MVNIKNKDIRAKDDFTEILTCTKERHVIQYMKWIGKWNMINGTQNRQKIRIG